MKFLAMPLIAASLVFAGCTSDSTEPSALEGVEEEAGAEPKDGDMIGLSLSEAEKLAVERGLLYRVTMLDGKPRPATRDLRENRVNFVVEAGKVLGVSRG